MGDAEVPGWLKSLPLAPEYRPTETEFADPIAFISKIEREAAAFGICKVVPPLPKPSKRFVFSNLNRSLSKSPELGTGAGSPENAAVFTTRHQELGSRRTRLAVHKQVWQSGEVYTLEQFEAKSKVFARSQLGNAKDASPLVVEALFWKAAADKPVYIEYANDVPGSGFGVPKDPFRCYSHRRRRKRNFDRGGQNAVGDAGGKPLEVPGLPERQQKGGSGSGSDREGTAGWKLSNSPWNLQVIARSPGSLTRFMPDEVPGVTSPMVYIGMMFSWFAWHVEDHELHSLNFLHTGSPKTWYAVPGDHASMMEEVVRVQGYGGNIDRLAAFMLLGEKTTLMSPDVIVASGIPCCRLVQNPGEFVVTFPRAYHVGFSHGFNCGEAANFATPKWLNVAKEAAVRRAAMNYLPMLSHQQLLYMLTMSFVSRVPRAFLPGARSSRLRDRRKEEREILVKKAFLDDMITEHHLAHAILAKDSAFCSVLWDPNLLPSPSSDPQSFSLSPSCEDSGFLVDECKKETVQCNTPDKTSLGQLKDHSSIEDVSHEAAVNTSENISSVECRRDGDCDDNNVNLSSSHEERMHSLYLDDGDLPCGLDIDSGTLACVACGILGYPFMSIVQPSDQASKILLSAEHEVIDQKIGNLNSLKPSVPSCLTDIMEESDSAVLPVSSSLPVTSMDNCGLDHIMMPIELEACKFQPDIENATHSKDTKFDDPNGRHPSDGLEEFGKSLHMGGIDTVEKESERSRIVGSGHDSKTEGVLTAPAVDCGEDPKSKWNSSNVFLRPRIFCLQHALEIEELLRNKGGARVLIICHSDYLKIKGQAMSVAEEFDSQFDFNDVPMKDASQADLNLINISIDDEGREEDGEDWTSKMGLNLRYCVKLRKHSSSKQERLTLALGGLFSDRDPLAVVAGLKWHSRKSRTHHRMATSGQSGLQDGINIEKDEQVTGNSCVHRFEKNQVNKSCRVEMAGHSKRRGRPRKEPSKELVGRNEASVTDDKGSMVARRSLSGCMTCIDEELINDSAELTKSPSISASTSESSQTHQDSLCLERKESNASLEIWETQKTEDSSRCPMPALENCANQLVIQVEDVDNAVCKISNSEKSASVSESLNMDQNIHFEEEVSKKCEVVNPVESACQPSIGLPTVESSETQQETVGKTDTKGKILKAGMSGNDLTAPVSLACGSEVILSTTNKEDTCTPGMLESQPIVSISTVDASEIQQETAAAEEITAGGNVGTPNSGQPTNSMVVADGSKMQDIHTEEQMSKAECESPSTIISSSVSKIQNDGIAEDTNMREANGIAEDTNMRVVVDSAESASCTDISILESSGMNLMLRAAVGENATANNASSLQIVVNRDNRLPNVVQLKLYERRRKKTQREVDPVKNDLEPPKRLTNKRKRELRQLTNDQFSGNGFARSPCEGLRPRSRSLSDGADNSVEKKLSENVGKRQRRARAGSVGHTKDKDVGLYGCDLEGCCMSFGTREELSLHKRNRCTYEGCPKRFSSHKYAIRHQRVHTDERPLKCPWKGCTMSFKWAWARTEHVRVHTGERPYECKVSGCGLTFRFVSDFSRHRRKTGHCVN